MMRCLRIVFLAFVASAASERGDAQTWDITALRSFSGLTPDQWKAVEGGEIEARVLDTERKNEVAVAGAARLRASAACFVERFQDIESFKKNAAVLRIEKFSPPPSPLDLAHFALEPRDLADLESCRVGDCKLKLSAEIIERLGRDVDWSRADAAMRAQSVIRDELWRYLEAYIRAGDSALMVYHDKEKPVPMASEFQPVLDARPGLAGLAPDFHEYLARYPHDALPGVRDFFYWSVETFGLKPVASITQVSMYVQPGQALTASKQLYASHYFDASLGMSAALDDPSDASEPHMYLVYLNRSRVDLLSGFFGGLRRAIMRGRLRDGMQKNLAEVVHRLESACGQYPAVNSAVP